MSRAEKYVDLADRIAVTYPYRATEVVLNWLDEHRDQAPGPTITHSSVGHAMKGHSGEFKAGLLAGLDLLGAEQIPETEPTNAEKLAGQIRLTLRENSPDTCKNVQDMVAEKIAADLDAAGVKAPDSSD